MTDSVLSDYFRPVTKTPFSELPTVIMSGCAFLAPGTNINTENLFNHVEIYEIPGWVRGKNKHAKIPYPGTPYVVLSAKRGWKIRGVVKHLDDKKEEEKGKPKFPTQVFLDVALKDKVVNIMIYENMFKVAGATKAEHVVESFIFLQAVLVYMQNQGIHIFDKVPVLSKVDVVMENVVFNLGFKVNREAFIKKAKECGLSSPTESEAIRICYPMNKKKAKGGDRFYNFRIQCTGKVVFSGDNRQSMKPIYDKFMQFILENETDIRFC